MRRHPTLTAVIAHLGMPEYAEHLGLAERYPNVHLDTTMAYTPFTEALMPMPRSCGPGWPGFGTGRSRAARSSSDLPDPTMSSRTGARRDHRPRRRRSPVPPDRA